MAFLPEDGTGTEPLANSYCSVAQFKAYWDETGQFDYTKFSPDVLIERALVVATRYIETKYRNRFRGFRLLCDQPLSFPRAYLFLYGQLLTGVPVLVIQATCEYARKQLELPFGLAPDPSVDASTGQIITESHVKVGPIEKTQTMEAGSGFTLRSYPYADSLLCPLSFDVGGVIRN